MRIRLLLDPSQAQMTRSFDAPRELGGPGYLYYN